MKFTKRVTHELVLGLTEEEVNAFETVSDCIVDLHNLLCHENTEGIVDARDRTIVISTGDLSAMADKLESLINAPSFGFMEDDDD